MDPLININSFIIISDDSLISALGTHPVCDVVATSHFGLI